MKAGIDHMVAARPQTNLMIWMYGLTGLTVTILGAALAYRGLSANTEIHIFGSSLSTTNVGIAMVFLGIVLDIATIRSVNKLMHRLADLPPERRPYLPVLPQRRSDKDSEHKAE